MVVTDEPGFTSRIGGVRLEEMVLIEKDGPESLRVTITFTISERDISPWPTILPLMFLRISYSPSTDGKSLAKNTIESYSRDLARYFDFLEKGNLHPLKASQITYGVCDFP